MLLLLLLVVVVIVVVGGTLDKEIFFVTVEERKKGFGAFFRKCDKRREDRRGCRRYTDSTRGCCGRMEGVVGRG